MGISVLDPKLAAKTAVFRYKCRRCGVVFNGAETGVPLAIKVLIRVAVLGKDTQHGIPVGMHTVHDCDANGNGIADIQGFDVTKDN